MSLGTSAMAHRGVSSLLAIDKLQGQSNYHQWRVSAEAVLRREQLWGRRQWPCDLANGG